LKTIQSFYILQPFLDIKSGYHPSLVSAVSSAEGTNSTYIPNDTMLGGDTPLTMLLTGPNMGGKSTLMRQVAALVILAQIVRFEKNFQ
jgi:DNA mismatch repair ATPase MutS